MTNCGGASNVSNLKKSCAGSEFSNTAAITTAVGPVLSTITTASTKSYF